MAVDVSESSDCDANESSWFYPTWYFCVATDEFCSRSAQQVGSGMRQDSTFVPEGNPRFPAVILRWTQLCVDSQALLCGKTQNPLKGSTNDEFQRRLGTFIAKPEVVLNSTTAHCTCLQVCTVVVKKVLRKVVMLPNCALLPSKRVMRLAMVQR